jgi:hypothetical protein
MASDPFQWAALYSQNMQQAANRDSNQAQQSLMSVFREEANRQQPYSNLPVDLAKINTQYDLQMRNNDRAAYLRGQASDAKANEARYNPAPEKVRGIIVAAANKWGVDPNIMLTIAELESGFKVGAKNPNSSATGLFQFINSTAEQYGIDPRDPYQSADAAARMAKQNLTAIASKIGKENVKPWHAYLAHQQGLGGALKLLSNPNMRATAVVGSKNAIGLNGGDDRMSAGAFANIWANKFNSSYEIRTAKRGGQEGENANPLDGLFGPEDTNTDDTGNTTIEAPEDENGQTEPVKLRKAEEENMPDEEEQDAANLDGAIPPPTRVQTTQVTPAPTMQSMQRRFGAKTPNPLEQSAAPVIYSDPPKAPKLQEVLVDGVRVKLKDNFGKQ